MLPSVKQSEEVKKLAKFIVDEEIAMKIIEAWGSGGLTKAIFKDICSKGQEIVYCEDCDSAYPCFSPFDRENYVRCTYLATGDGKMVPRQSFCATGERRKDNACE